MSGIGVRSADVVAGRWSRIAAAVVVVAIAGLAIAVAGWTVAQARSEDARVAGAPVTGPTAPVTRETLATRVSLAGELGFGALGELAVKATGTITWLPRAGTVLRPGDVVARVDDHAVVLLVGKLPMYRVLEVPEPVLAKATAADTPPPGEAAGAGSGDGGSKDTTTAPRFVQPPPLRGRDVRQFERSLRALGYTGFTVDATYTDRTASAVRRWQAEVGMRVTGRVGPAEVVYVRGPLRVNQALVNIGDDAGGDTLAVTSTSRTVSLDVPVSDAAWAVPGTKVRVVLPGDRSVPGTVSSVSTRAEPGGQESGVAEVGGGDAAVGNATVRVTVRPRQSAVTALTRSPVRVSYTSEEHRDVLTVPVTALLALAEGGYGVELVEDGVTRVVAVTAGLFDDARVEIEGPLAEGALVRIPGMSVVSLAGVSKVHAGGVHALRAVDLEIGYGELVGIVGPSGSGKSTLLNIIGTLDRPTAGRVRVDGHDVGAMADRRLSALRAARIGFVFQQFHLAGGVPVLDNVSDGILYSGLPLRQRRRRAVEALERVGLGHRLGHRPHQLSGGERQRVAIARAVVGGPALLLADEPTGNLDSVAGAAVLSLLQELNERGTTVVVITHDHEVAARCLRQVQVRDGVVSDAPNTFVPQRIPT